jgi:hypothetical protein
MRKLVNAVGSKTALTALKCDFRSASDNRHRRAASPCPFSANFGEDWDNTCQPVFERASAAPCHPGLVVYAPAAYVPNQMSHEIFA